MTTRGSLSIAGIEEYLEQIEATGRHVDDAVAEAIGEASPLVTEEMHRLLRASSETWTGSTDATIEQTGPQRDGNFTFIEIELHAEDDPAGIYKEFGTARQAAEPFFRPAFANMRHRWRNKVKEVLERLGVA